MLIIKPQVKILTPNETLQSNLQIIEIAGRTCYKSEDKISENSYIPFIKNIIKRGHESVIEHGYFSAVFITDRAVTHQLVRHRIVSYSQESQRYVIVVKPDSSKEAVFIDSGNREVDSEAWNVWVKSLENAERDYATLISLGEKPEQARDVLPNSCKTEIVVTANFRQWRHILSIRTDKHAQKPIRDLMNNLLDQLLETPIGFIFEDIKE